MKMRETSRVQDKKPIDNNKLDAHNGIGSNAEAILPINQLPKLLGLDKMQNGGVNLSIENFNNNTDKDIEYLANELAFYLSRKRIGMGGAFQMEFTFNGVSSRNFNIKVKNSNHLSIPRRKLEFVEIQGRSDNLIIDEGCREMLDIELEVYIDCRSADTLSYAKKLDEWLNNPIGYQNLLFDDGTSLKAVFVGQIDFNEGGENFNEIILQFKAYRVGDLQ